MTDTQKTQALIRARANELHASHESASINSFEVLGEPDENGNVLVQCVCGVLLSVHVDKDEPKKAADRNVVGRVSVKDGS